MRWLYLKLVQGVSNIEIAELNGPTADSDDVDDSLFITEATVTNKTKIVADLLGISVPRRRKPTS